MEKLYELKEILMDSIGELDTMKGHKLKMGELDAIKDIASSMDHLCNVVQDMEMEGGHSGAGYGRGSSYANRGQHYVRGHYSRDGGRENGMSYRRDDRGRYSRGDGRSEMMEHLEMALDSADEKDRDMIKRMMRQIENA